MNPTSVDPSELPSERQFPIIKAGLPDPQRPISFVTIRYSDEFDHNIMRSGCVHDPRNEFIVVDNRQDLFFDTLCEAIDHGVAQASHELIAIVHEDVVLLPGWQSMMEFSLQELENHDPDWGLVGAVGWDTNKDFCGHWSDPSQFKNTFNDQPFLPVTHLDEQLLIFRRSRLLQFDPNLPSIHNIGRDLARTGRSHDLSTYAIDAPTIHKYADSSGNPVMDAASSHKIQHRKTATYLADRACSDEYLNHKWNISAASQVPDKHLLTFEPPLILLLPGGLRPSLRKLTAQDYEFFGQTAESSLTNVPDDPFVQAMFRSVIREYKCPSPWQKAQSCPDLITSAQQAVSSKKWMIDCSTTALILPTIIRAFPHARYLTSPYEPTAAVAQRLRGPGLLGNHIGRITLVAAYDFFGIERKHILSDTAVHHATLTVLHELQLIKQHRRRVDSALWLSWPMPSPVISFQPSQRKIFNDFCQTTATRADVRAAGHLDQVAHTSDLTDSQRILINDLSERYDIPDR